MTMHDDRRSAGATASDRQEDHCTVMLQVRDEPSWDSATERLLEHFTGHAHRVIETTVNEVQCIQGDRQTGIAVSMPTSHVGAGDPPPLAGGTPPARP